MLKNKFFIPKALQQKEECLLAGLTQCNGKTHKIKIQYFTQSTRLLKKKERQNNTKKSIGKTPIIGTIF